MTTIKAIFKGGRVKLLEPAPDADSSEVIVIFLGNESGTGAADDRNASWPTGFFSRTAGRLRSSPIRRHVPGRLERRRSIR